MKLLGVLLFTIVFLSLNSARSEDLEEPVKKKSINKKMSIVSDIEKKTECVEPPVDTHGENIIFTPINPIVFLDGEYKHTKDGQTLVFVTRKPIGRKTSTTRQVLTKPVELFCISVKSAKKEYSYQECDISTGNTNISVTIDGLSTHLMNIDYAKKIKSALISSGLFEACLSSVSDLGEISNEPSKKQKRKDNSRGLASEEIP